MQVARIAGRQNTAHAGNIRSELVMKVLKKGEFNLVSRMFDFLHISGHLANMRRGKVAAKLHLLSRLNILLFKEALLITSLPIRRSTGVLGNHKNYFL